MKRTTTSPDGILRTARAYVEAQALFLALKTGIFESVGSKPCSLRSLLRRLDLHPQRGRALIEWLIAQRLLEQGGRRMLALTDSARRFLLSDHPESVRQFVLWKAHVERFWVRNAERALLGRAKTVYGPHCYSHVGKRGVSELFQSALSGIERPVYHEVARILGRYVAPAKTILATDLGCGAGGLSLSILSAFPNSKCICADINVTAARRAIRAHSLDRRARICKLDFTKDSIPTSDVLFLCMVLSDWNDKMVRVILDKCYQALPAGGILVVVEYVKDMTRDAHATSQMDFLLSMETDGYLRCKSEWRKALRRFSRVVFEELPQNVTAIVATRSLRRISRTAGQEGVSCRKP